MATTAVILCAFFMVVDLRRIRLDSGTEAEKFEKQAQFEAQSGKDHSEDKIDKVDADPESDSEEDAHDLDSEEDSDEDSGAGSDSDSLLLEGAEEDPEGLCMAVKAILEPFRGLWFITRGDSQEHEDYNEDVQPKLFCRSVAPHATVKDLVKDLMPLSCNDTSNRSYFKSSYTEKDLLEWFECDEEDDGYDVDDDASDGFADGLDVPTCEERKEVAKKVQNLFAQHGKEQFFYRLEHDEGLVTTDGIGVVTASGFAVGIEASPVYWDP